MKVIKRLIKNLSNLPGWRTNRKIIVFESDDWGSIRMPSKKAYRNLTKANSDLGDGVEGRYNQYDTLASAEDLSALFDVLQSIKDKNNHSAKFTALSLVANPDFQKIKESSFSKYHYENLKQTLERYNRADAFSLWQQGKKADLFVPEFHGREHLNVQLWMRALRQKDEETLIAFENQVTGINRSGMKIEYQAAFDLELASDLTRQKNIIQEGLNLFEQLHDYRASFFVPPNGPINNELEKTAADNGIKYMSSPKIQTEVLGDGITKKHLRYLGKKNNYGQLYITRNAIFEPSGATNNQVESCLSEIELAFKFRKPAVISSHRVNYVGGIDEKNRTYGLKQLDSLLTRIQKKWPEVEFMTSSELGRIIKN